MDTPTPLVFWKPSALAPLVELAFRGVAQGSPFADLSSALAAAGRSREERGDSVFMILREPDGWHALEYTESRLDDVDLDEIEPRGLPLAADPDAPLTFLIDSKGCLGRVRSGAEGGVVEPLERAADGRLFPTENLSRAYRVRLPPAAVQEPVPLRPVVSGFVVPGPLRNHGRNVEWTPKYALRPGGSRTTLRSALRWIDAELAPSIKIRPVGSRHSWSSAAATAGVSILPGDWAGASSLHAAEVVAGVDPAAHCRVLAGTRIREINAQLWRVGRAVECLGGFDGQTIGGVLPTGTHGSRLACGPLADFVRSIDLFTYDGRALRIEPARRPITNPANHAHVAPDLELRIDDDLFDAVRLGLGACGVIHSLVLETRPRFWMKEIRTLSTIAEAANALGSGKVYGWLESKRPTVPAAGFSGHPRPAYHGELLWNPYTGLVVVTTRHPVDAVMQQKLERSEPAFFESPPTRNLLRLVGLDAMASEFSRPDPMELEVEYFGRGAVSALEAVAQAIPSAVPALVDAGIRSIEDSGFIQRSYHVFNIGRAANLLPAQSATLFIPLRDDLWLRAVEIVAHTARRELESGRVQTGPIAVRFVAGSTAMLAPDEDVCSFEFIFGGDRASTQETAVAVTRSHFRALRRALGSCVWLHWGQVLPPGAWSTPDADGRHAAAASYPRFARWMEIRDGLDPKRRGLTGWLQQQLPPP
ncbi:MAG: FAD-binding protein [Planctomycetes bacterium]|nr:FAD-binding protein [Planctomycetota bacterium]